jgi:hypothetical protein
LTDYNPAPRRKGSISMSDQALRSKLIRLAHQNPELRPHLLPLVTKTAALPDGTVKTFLMVLTSKLTQYDKRLSARDGNIYRLSHLLKASQDIERRMAKLLDHSDQKSLETLKAAIAGEFTRPPIPPVANTLKQIDAFIATGKLPSLSG